MNLIHDSIMNSIDKGALEKYHNEYEAYAVILEGYDRLSDEIYCLQTQVESFWNEVKRRGDTHNPAEFIRDFAISVACKAAKVAHAANKATFPYYEKLTE